MKQIVDTSEILGTMELPEGIHEVCASARAAYDESAKWLVVNLDCFLRAADIRTKEKTLTVDWLPKPETLTESASLEEAVEAARDIFHRWVRKVRQASPSLHQPSF